MTALLPRRATRRPVERDDGQVIAFEVKAGTRVSSEDLRGLRLLKDRLGSRLQEAVVLYTGEHAYRHDGWIWIMPLSQLWRPEEGLT